MLSPLPIASTFSKDPVFWAAKFLPRKLVCGKGAHVVDEDNKIYLDWVSALGANILGYSNETFVQRVVAAISAGAGFSLPHYLEWQVAEKLVTLLGNHVPKWSPETLGVRFGLSGTDATTMAVRLARAVTGRKLILSAGYHGWADWSVSVTPPAWGVDSPQHVEEFAFGVMDYWPTNSPAEAGRATLEAAMNDGVAAIIFEVPIQEPDSGWYKYARTLCNKYGALLILDEVVTGLRFSLGGAAERYGIEPDIICMGKGLGNGLPISAIVGRREYFDWFSRTDPVFISSTHFGNAVSLAAADAMLDIWDERCVNHIWAVGEALVEGLRRAGCALLGNGARSLLQFPTLAQKTFFTLAMRDAGILINRPNLPNLAHTAEDVDKTVEAAAEAISDMAKFRPRAMEKAMKNMLPRVLFSNR